LSRGAAARCCTRPGAAGGVRLVREHAVQEAPEHLRVLQRARHPGRAPEAEHRAAPHLARRRPEL
jgi:hypothetical protein